MSDIANSNPDMLQNPSALMLAGMRDMIPFLISGAPLAVIGGAYGVASGLGWFNTLLLAMSVNSGTVQFVATRLLSEGASALTLFLTTLVLCLRLIFYSTILGPQVRKLPMRWQMLLGFGLIDAIFFLVKKRLDEGHKEGWHWYYLGGTGLMYMVWMGATLLGTITGTLLSLNSAEGLDFPMTALFAAMLGTTLANWHVVVAIISAGVLSILLASLPYGLGIIVAALAGATIGFCSKNLLKPILTTSTESAK